MERTDWKLGWRLWSPRSFAEAIDTRSGDSVRLVLARRGGALVYDRFGPNVGQPDPSPPRHEAHRDIEALAAGLRLGCWSLDGCYELELERPEVHARILLADSRSVACGPSDDPVMRQGVLLVSVDVLRVEAGYELGFQLSSGAPLIALALDGPVRVRDRMALLSRGKSAVAFGRMPPVINVSKADKRIRRMTSFVRYYGPDQLSGPQRMGHAVRWNVCWDADAKDIYLAASRSWVEMIARAVGAPEQVDGPLTFAWDAALSALLVAGSAPSLARAIVRSVLRTQQPSGRIPFLSLGSRASVRMAPPVLPIAVWYLSYDGRVDFAEQVFDALARSHRWMIEHREPRHDGLLCWSDGSHDGEGGELAIDGWVGAAYESGLDDSPMWEELGFDASSASLGQGCVDLTSLAALSARILAALAERVGRDPAPYVADYRRIARAVNERMWSGDEIYRNLRVDGSHAGEISPTSFYPLIAGIASREQAAATVRGFLINRAHFGHPPVLPSVSRSSASYDGDGDYWRGRVWPPLNYMVWGGLRQLGPERAKPFAQLCRDVFDAEWERHGHVHENYSGETGHGEPEPGHYARSCPFYCWGGLLLLPDVESKGTAPLSFLPPIDRG